MNSTAVDWVASEFNTVSFGDERLNNRFIGIASQLACRFGSNIASSFTQWKEIKAAYRFFSNNKVNTSAILTPHKQQTLKRIKSQKRILLIQDTTYFNFGNRPRTTGLDVTQRSKLSKESEGLMLHNTLAVSEAGTPLGLLDQYFIDRKQLQGENYQEKRHIRHWNHAVTQKESLSWIKILKKANAINFGDTEVIHVADRESDMYEFFRESADLG